MNAGRMLIAASVLAAVSALTHVYAWMRLVRDPAWPAPWRLGLTVGLVALAGIVPVAFFAMRWLPRNASAPLAWVAYVWMGLALYVLLLSAATDLFRLTATLVDGLPRDPERRTAFARAVAGFIAAGAGLVGLGGGLNVARGFEVRRVRVPLAKLPRHATGYCIVQLSDVHVGPTLGRSFVERVVRATNAQQPDLVVITGDLVDGTVEQLAAHVEPLRELTAKHGVFFVTGNHEYYSGADEWIAHLATLGIRVLRNEHVDVAGAFVLAGVDDLSAHRILPTHGQDVPRALSGRDPSRPVVLLAHQPKALPDARAGGVDLQLSGHVHGGQMFPFNWLARLDQPVIAGLHRIGDTWIYVSTGTGYWGPPMRVGPGAEITRIELVGA